MLAASVTRVACTNVKNARASEHVDFGNERLADKGSLRNAWGYLKGA